MTSYCEYTRNLPKGNVHRDHHDTEHGFYVKDDDDLFRRFVLEIMQAGLSFETVLKKKKAIYLNFNKIKKVAEYKEKEIEILMQNKNIIRHRLKIESIIYNAKKIIQLQKEYGSFKKFLDLHKGLELDEWVKLFKKEFKFVGPEIVNELLMSARYLKGAHDKNCEIEKKIINFYNV
ncbi:MAG: DNA-3-methyladenine glycosylase I [Candidatus Woesearchaeota archaeon]